MAESEEELKRFLMKVKEESEKAGLKLNIQKMTSGIRSHQVSESCSVVSDSLRPHGLYNPYNSLGQKTGVGSLSFLQGIFPTQGSNPGFLHCKQMLYPLSHQGSPNKTYAKSFQSCPTLCDPRDGSPPGSPVPGIPQARTLEWVAISFSRGSFQARDRTQVSYIAGRFFTI